VTAPDAAPDAAPTHPWRGTILVLISAASFGTTLVFTQRALNAGATLPALLAYRYALGAALLCVVAGGIGEVVAVGARKWQLLSIGGSAQAAIAGLSVSALQFIPAASVAFLFYTYPTWVAVLAIVRGTERVDAQKVAALALSLAGIVTMVGNPFSTQLDPRGIALALTDAVIYALLIPWLGKIQQGLKTPAAVTWMAAGAAVWFVAGALILRSPLLHPSSALLVNAVALAAIPTALALITFVAGLALLGPVRTSIVSTVEPFFVALLAWVVLGQQVGPRTWIGGAMIAAAMLLLQRKASRDA
jgi:drug/metabolite transporter (DMT)-like permease